MIDALSQPEIQQFIFDHEKDDERRLVLQKKELFGVPTGLIADQLAGRRKAKEKLPQFYKTPGVIYPPGLNLEQSSSEQTGNYKAEIVTDFLDKVHRKSVIDLTGGFGIDSFHFAKIFTSVEYIEPNQSLLEIARHNHGLLNAPEVKHHHSTAEKFLDEFAGKADLMFIDPSRRNEDKKVFTFSDSTPDVTSLQSQIFEKANYLLIKAAPLLDIKLGLQTLSSVKNVFVVAVENEVKEVLFLCEKHFKGEPKIIAVNLLRADVKEEFNFTFTEEQATRTEFADPLTFLYEPNAAILKSGAFKCITKRFAVTKIQAATHLYTSAEKRDNFPGRVFKMVRKVKPDAKELAKIIPEGKANITTRNYPLSVDDLRKKTKLTDGGDKYLIGFSGVNEKYLVLAERLK